MLGLDFFSKFTVGGVSYAGTGVNVNLGIRPAFRYTPINSFSLFIRPAIGVNVHDFWFTQSYVDYTMIDANFLFDLNLGGRSWFFNIDGFHIGLAYGIDFNFGGGSGYISGNNYRAFDYNNFYASMKIYLGLCLNFGDRGFDRL